MSLAAQLLEIAKSRRLMITTAESCTGGLLGAALTDLAGSSALFDRGFLTYTNAAKTELLGVRDDTLMAHGAVSEPVAREMAEGALARSAADLALSITGIAGPGGSEFKPEGRVCFGWASGWDSGTESVDFGALGRGAVRRAARDHALSIALRLFQAAP